MSGDCHEPLVDMLRNGHVDAWHYILRRYESLLIRFVRRRLPVRIRPRVDAEDIVQETFRSIIARERRTFSL